MFSRSVVREFKRWTLSSGDERAQIGSGCRAKWDSQEYGFDGLDFPCASAPEGRPNRVFWNQSGTKFVIWGFCGVFGIAVSLLFSWSQRPESNWRPTDYELSSNSIESTTYAFLIQIFRLFPSFSTQISKQIGKQSASANRPRLEASKTAIP